MAAHGVDRGSDSVLRDLVLVVESELVADPDEVDRSVRQLRTELTDLNAPRRSLQPPLQEYPDGGQTHRSDDITASLPPGPTAEAEGRPAGSPRWP